jgi:hypothetical protein
LTATLEAENFGVEAVTSAREAAIALRQRAFDLVITGTDIDPPTGYEVVVILSSSSLPAAESKRQGVRIVLLNGCEPSGKMIAILRLVLESCVRVRHMGSRRAGFSSHIGQAQPPRMVHPKRLRVIVPHGRDDVIDSFACSACRWFYAIKDPNPFEISWQECRRACDKFDGHVCSDYLPKLAAAG